MKKPPFGGKIGQRAQKMIYAGLDLHKKLSVIAAANTTGGELVKQRKVPNDREIVNLFQGLGEPVEVATEAISSSRRYRGDMRGDQ